MGHAARLVLLLLLGGCGLTATDQNPIRYPVTADSEVLSFVDYPGPGAGNTGCIPPAYSNMSCPFSLKRTVDFKASFVEEQRCSCFPEISSQKSVLNEEQKNSYLKLAQSIHTFNSDGSSCASDLPFTSMIIKKPDGEEQYLVTSNGYTGCGGSGNYVDGEQADSLGKTIHESVVSAPVTKERALRPIYNEHHGFSMMFPLFDSKQVKNCGWQRYFIYKADAQYMEVQRCDEYQGMMLQTIKLDDAENARLLAALKSLQVPSIGSAQKSCSANPSINFEIYQNDGTPEPYFFDGPSCELGINSDAYDRHIFLPTAEDFLNLLSVYDNF